MIKFLIRVYIHFRDLICKCFCSCKKTDTVDDITRENSVETEKGK